MGTVYRKYLERTEYYFETVSLKKRYQSVGEDIPDEEMYSKYRGCPE